MEEANSREVQEAVGQGRRELDALATLLGEKWEEMQAVKARMEQELTAKWEEYSEIYERLEGTKQVRPGPGGSQGEGGPGGGREAGKQVPHPCISVEMSHTRQCQSR